MSVRNIVGVRVFLECLFSNYSIRLSPRWVSNKFREDLGVNWHHLFNHLSCNPLFGIEGGLSLTHLELQRSVARVVGRDSA